MKVLALICLVATVGYVRAYQSCPLTNNQPDIVLVVEDSSFLPAGSVLTLQTFLAEIANNFHLDDDAARVAYQQYTTDEFYNVFYLNKYTETNDAKAAIMLQNFNLTTVTYSPSIATALDYTWTQELTVTNGERSCHPTVVILVSFSSYQDPNGRVGDKDPYLIAKDLTAVRRLKHSGALVITVGVGQNADPGHMLELATSPEYWHEFSDFADLTIDAADIIAAQACAYTFDDLFVPCEMEVIKADVVFVIDTSAKFLAPVSFVNPVITFMNETLARMTYGADGVQAALVTYQKDATPQIYLDDNNAEGKGLSGFLNSAQSFLENPCSVCTDRCVDEALDLVRRHIFVTARGYRPDCTVHFIYVITSDCFNCGDPVPIANNLRDPTAFPNTELYVVTLDQPLGFWKEYLEIADSYSNVYQAQLEPPGILDNYLFTRAWSGVCRAYDSVGATCALTSRAPPPVSGDTEPPITPSNSSDGSFLDEQAQGAFEAFKSFFRRAPHQ